MSRYICYFVVGVLFFCEFRTLVFCEDCLPDRVSYYRKLEDAWFANKIAFNIFSELNKTDGWMIYIFEGFNNSNTCPDTSIVSISLADRSFSNPIGLFVPKNEKLGIVYI